MSQGIARLRELLHEDNGEVQPYYDTMPEEIVPLAVELGAVGELYLSDHVARWAYPYASCNCESWEYGVWICPDIYSRFGVTEADINNTRIKKDGLTIGFFELVWVFAEQVPCEVLYGYKSYAGGSGGCGCFGKTERLNFWTRKEGPQTLRRKVRVAGKDYELGERWKYCSIVGWERRVTPMHRPRRSCESGQVSSEERNLEDPDGLEGC